MQLYKWTPQEPNVCTTHAHTHIRTHTDYKQTELHIFMTGVWYTGRSFSFRQISLHIKLLWLPLPVCCAYAHIILYKWGLCVYALHYTVWPWTFLVHICMCTSLQSRVVCVCVSVERLMLMSQAHFTCIQKGQGKSFYDFARRECLCLCVCVWHYVGVHVCLQSKSCMYCILCMNTLKCFISTYNNTQELNIIIIYNTRREQGIVGSLHNVCVFVCDWWCKIVR